MPFDDDLEDYRILRLDEVLRLRGLSRSQFLRLRAAGLAPAGRRLGPRSVGYPRREVREWLQSLPPVSPDYPE